MENVRGLLEKINNRMVTRYSVLEKDVDLAVINAGGDLKFIPHSGLWVKKNGEKEWCKLHEASEDWLLPSTECVICLLDDLEERLEKSRVERSKTEENCRMILNQLDSYEKEPSTSSDLTGVLGLLAVLHGDGGHHTEEVGLAQSCEDALNKYYRLLRERSDSEEEEESSEDDPF